MLGKPGPFQIIESEGCGDVDAPIAAPRRRYECLHYTTCLNLAAALNWDSFTCRGCNSEIDEVLLWRARQAQKKDSVARSLCACPPIHAHEVQPKSAGLSHGGSANEVAENTPTYNGETDRTTTQKTVARTACATKGSTANGENGAVDITEHGDVRPVGAVVSLFGKRTLYP